MDDVVFGSVTVGNLLGAAVVVAVSIAAALVIRVLLLRSSRRQSELPSATWYTVAQIATYTVLGIGVLLTLSVLGVSMSRLAVVAGGLGIGLGFGLQTIFANFVSGLVLLFDRSLKVGDFIELDSGVSGEVRDIKIRATRITTNDNVDILVPNSEFVNGKVINWTYREAHRRLRVPFGVAYGTDKDVVKQAALEAAEAVPFTLSSDPRRGPRVWLTEFGDSSLNYELVVWLTAEATKRPAAVVAAYNWEIHTALARHDLEIPFPQRDLHLRSMFGLADDEARRALDLGDPSPEPETSEAPTSSAANDAVDDVLDAPVDITDEGEEPDR